MASITRNHLYTVDLNKPLTRQSCGILLAEGDNNGDCFTFTLMRDGVNAAVDSTAVVSGYMIRQDGYTVDIDGICENNCAKVVLDERCYAKEGHFTLTVKIEVDGVTVTIAMLDGFIRNVATGISASPDEVVDSADALEAVILAGHTHIIIPENTTMEIRGLALTGVNGATIENRGKVSNTNGGPIVTLKGCSNVHLTGGEWVGDGSTDSQSLIVLDGCTNCRIDSMHISGAKNKAVEIKGNTTGCMVECLHIIGANGTSGAGVSLWGAAVTHNIISHIYCEDVRLAIAANGCSYNTFDDITCINTTSNGGGVLFDGMVTYSGDGAHDNVLSNLVVVNAGQYGGLYFGNGAHGNTCENIAVADSNHGVRMYSEQATPCYGNTVRGGTIKNCSEDGVVLSQCNDNEVSGFVITNCPRGVDLFAASHNSVHDCIVRDCTINGIRVMTDYASIANCKVRRCASGIELAYGSGKNPADIMIEETWLIDNTTQYTPANGIQLGSTCRQFTTA